MNINHILKDESTHFIEVHMYASTHELVGNNGTIGQEKFKA